MYIELATPTGKQYSTPLSTLSDEDSKMPIQYSKPLMPADNVSGHGKNALQASELRGAHVCTCTIYTLCFYSPEHTLFVRDTKWSH